MEYRGRRKHRKNSAVIINHWAHGGRHVWGMVNVAVVWYGKYRKFEQVIFQQSLHENLNKALVKSKNETVNDRSRLHTQALQRATHFSMVWSGMDCIVDLIMTRAASSFQHSPGMWAEINKYSEKNFL